jgi:uncharacterized membrane protein YesL
LSNRTNRDRQPNDALFENLDKAANLIIANLLFVLLSIPLVTLPLTTAGLFNVTSRWARRQSYEVFRDFFEGMRHHWRRAVPIFLMDVALAGLIILNFSIFPRMDSAQPIALVSQSVTIFVGMSLAMVNFYLWPLLVTFEDLSLRLLLDRSVRLVFIHPGWSLLTLALVAGIVIVSLIVLPGAAWALFTFSTIALLVNRMAWRVIRRYVSQEELAALEGKG